MAERAEIWKRKIAAFAQKEPFFLLVAVLTGALSFFSRPRLSAVHWDVITTLFSLMLVCIAFEQCGLLTALGSLAAGLFHTRRSLGLMLTAVTGMLAMAVTNDVALLTIVPLTIVIAQNARTDPVRLIILETLAANLFSTLTPFGNPQNLYLYSYFHIPPAQFFAVMAPFCAGSAVVLAALGLGWNRGGRLPPAGVQPEIREPKLLTGAAVAFVCNILSVLHIVDTRISLAVTVGIFLVLAPRLFKQADYFLLLTFVLFFLFTSSITAIPAVRTFFAMALHSRPAVLLYATGLSQVLSNVPTAVLLSGFTSRYRELLYGVSAGGLGTPVASLASIISYKLYIRKYPGGHYMRPFTIVNFGVLALLLAGLLLGERGL